MLKTLLGVYLRSLLGQRCQQSACVLVRALVRSVCLYASVFLFEPRATDSVLCVCTCVCVHVCMCARACASMCPHACERCVRAFVQCMASVIEFTEIILKEHCGCSQFSFTELHVSSTGIIFLPCFLWTNEQRGREDWQKNKARNGTAALSQQFVTPIIH